MNVGDLDDFHNLLRARGALLEQLLNQIYQI